MDLLASNQSWFLTSRNDQIKKKAHYLNFGNYVYFQLDHLLKSEIDSEDRFEIRRPIFQFNIFSWGLWQKMRKKDFFLVFVFLFDHFLKSKINSDLKKVGPYFYSNFISWSVLITNEKTKIFYSHHI